MASDPNLQVLGAAYIQHKCYSDPAAKKQVTDCPRCYAGGPLVPEYPC